MLTQGEIDVFIFYVHKKLKIVKPHYHVNLAQGSVWGWRGDKHYGGEKGGHKLFMINSSGRALRVVKCFAKNLVLNMDSPL